VCVVADGKRRRQYRVPPDPKRLEGVCWIGHTSWSHTPEAPR
jgi:hypothetical protein